MLDCPTSLSGPQTGGNERGTRKLLFRFGHQPEAPARMSSLALRVGVRPATMAHAQWEARCPECHSGSSLHATSRRTRHKTLSALVLRLRRLNGNYWHLTCVPFFASVHRKSVDKDSRFGWIFRDIGSHLKQT